METTLKQILNLLIEPQGNLIYHTVLVFSVIMALQATLLNKARMPKSVTRRTVFGLVVVLLIQLSMFIASGLAWQGLFNTHILIPPLDRAVLFITIAWIIWIWATPDTNRAADVGVVILTFLGIILVIFSVSAWNSEGTSQSFNGTYLDWGWQIASLALCIIGLVGLFIQRPTGRSAGIGFLLIIIAGICFHLVFLQPSADLSGIIRVFSLCCFPLLPILAQRYPIETSEPTVSAGAGINKGQEVEVRKRLTSEPRTVSAWLKLANQTDPDQIQIALTRAVSRTLLADFTFLIYIDAEMGSLEIECGYDLIREEPIAGTRLSISSVPALVSSIQRGKALRLSTNGTPPQDLITLTRVFGLNESGHLLAIPLMVNPGVWNAGLVLLTPYSNRLWSTEDQNILIGMSEALGQVLQRVSTINDSRIKAEQSQYEINDLRLQVENLQVEAENLRLASENQTHQNMLAHLPERLPEISTLMELQQESQVTIQRLQKENDELHQLLVRNGPFAVIPEDPVSNDEQMRVGLIDPEPGTSYFSSQPREDVPADIRTSSLDILGSGLDHFSKLVAFEETIDQAISATSGLFRDKSITLKINFPDSLAAIRVEEGVWRQVLVELLQNATAVMPNNGVVRLKIELPETGQTGSLLSFQISDGLNGEIGDGSDAISKLSEPNQSNLSIAGDSDSVVSMIKPQIEAHGGRIELQTNNGQGRRICVLIPIQNGRDQ
ncbi:MAG TPA: hypothetical protein VN452_07515 [Longilinea sp.]|nr:hypothetical protein [Longilinea sp.]